MTADPSKRLVLCYHAVSHGFPAALSVTPDAFDRQIDRLAGRGWKGVTFGELVESKSSERLVAITFDDAYESVDTLARPILDAAGIPASVYAPTAHIGSAEPMRWDGIEQWHGGPWEGELVPMGWDDLGRLAALGWEVGSHTCTHPHLTTLSDDELERELTVSREQCEKGTGAPCDTLAYPYGDTDARVAAAAAAAGYVAAGTLPSRLHPAEPLLWPRVGIYHTDSMRRFASKVSPVVNRMRSGRLWDTLDGARRAIRRA